MWISMVAAHTLANVHIFQNNWKNAYNCTSERLYAIAGICALYVLVEESEDSFMI
jgi:hypothetical protein